MTLQRSLTKKNPKLYIYIYILKNIAESQSGFPGLTRWIDRVLPGQIPDRFFHQPDPV
jgi:hypothetical protein